MNTATPRPVFEEIVTCNVCNRVVCRSLQHGQDPYAPRSCCAQPCARTVVLTDPSARLGGFRLGDRIEADLVRRDDHDDEITREVTKQGQIGRITVEGGGIDLRVDFEDGDFQGMNQTCQNGSVPGYPTRAFRLLPALPRGTP